MRHTEGKIEEHMHKFGTLKGLGVCAVAAELLLVFIHREVDVFPAGRSGRGPQIQVVLLHANLQLRKFHLPC